MKLVCISDTHGDHANLELPNGDVLIHAGDVTGHGTEQDFLDFLAWYESQPHQHKIFVAGNHDRFLETSEDVAAAHVKSTDVIWLNDTGVCLNGVNFWGSPITLQFHDWAFMRNPGADIEKHWALIPENTDVLVTHGPPYGILDLVKRLDGSEEKTGCPLLKKAIIAIQPKVHIFGHIHEEYRVYENDGIEYLNVSTMNQSYRIANDPVVYELP